MVEKKYTSDKENINNTQHLRPLGWTSHFQTHRQGQDNDELLPARVIGVRKNTLRVSNGKKEWLASVAGRLKHQSNGVYPVTGDWVLTTDTVILKVLGRKNALSRGASGTRGKQDAQPRQEQVIAANLDTVFVVCGLDRDYNLRRIERYLTLIYNCGLKPVIILTKADLHPNPDQCVAEVEMVAFGVPVHLISALDNAGLSSLEHYLSPGQTTTMVGSSGAGKSTLVNRLCGRTVQATGSISAHIGKGKHTTTTRDLIMMPQGGMVIDNPGIREIAFWSDDSGIDTAFPEIENYSRQCRFANCSHVHEPGCRVLLAVADGEMLPDRLESYQKMKRELAYLSKRRHKSADRVEKEQWRDVALKIKAMKKE
jgi:ribosome biogenesis GTPase